jgi:hypothetical protein
MLTIPCVTPLLARWRAQPVCTDDASARDLAGRRVG